MYTLFALEYDTETVCRFVHFLLATLEDPIDGRAQLLIEFWLTQIIGPAGPLYPGGGAASEAVAAAHDECHHQKELMEVMRL